MSVVRDDDTVAILCYTVLRDAQPFKHADKESSLEHRYDGGRSAECGFHGIAVLVIASASGDELAVHRTLAHDGFGTAAMDLESLCLLYLNGFLQQHKVKDGIVQFCRLVQILF